jgi:hypothetical protein
MAFFGLEADMAGDDRGLAGELDVAYSTAEEFGRLALEWLTDGVRFLAGDVSDEILAGPPLKPYWHKGVIDEEDPRFAVRVPPLWGDVSILYPPRNMFYAKPYSRTSLKRLAALAPELNEATVSLRRESASGRQACAVAVSRVGEDSGYARLLVWLYPGENGDYAADCPAVVFMRGFAERYAPVFGHVSYADSVTDAETQLEQALNRRPRHTLPEWDRYLRGYSWVTVIPAALAARVGGASGLRDSGAFARLDEVAGGSLWLQAASRWSEFRDDQASVDRVFNALAPVLPPGMPESYRVVRPASPLRPDLPEIRARYLLSARNAAD